MRHYEQQEKLADDARLLRARRKWHREELETALSGPHGAMVERLMFILKGLTLESAPLLLAYIRGVDWVMVDYPTRLTVLHEINTAITKLRERSGQEPLDDGFPGDCPNVFQTIRTILIPAEAAPLREIGETHGDGMKFDEILKGYAEQQQKFLREQETTPNNPATRRSNSHA